MIKIRRCCCYYTRSYEKNVDYQKMQDIVNKYSAIFIDVRSEQEFREGHINGAINIPLYKIKSEIMNKVNDKNKYIILYCTSGVRSRKAQNILSTMGYVNVYNLINGFNG